MTPTEARTFAIAAFSPAAAFPFIPLREENLEGTILRDFQIEVLREASRLMRLGYRRVLVVLPTGAGKTILAAVAMAGAISLGFSAQFIVHRRELLKQTSASFTKLGLEHGMIASGWAPEYDAMMSLAGIQTLASRLNIIFPTDLTILDEAHHAVSATYSTVMQARPDSYVLGLTATPLRLDGKGLESQFDAIVVGPSTADLIEWGYLSPFEYYAPSRPDTASLPSTAGDYSKAAASDLMDKPKLIGDTVEHYLRLAKGEKGLVFGVTREHSRNLAEAFRGNGVSAAHIDGSMGDKERDRIDQGFRAGEFDVMTSVDLIGEGYDVPAVSYVALDRPSKSLVVVRQQAGRALRIFDGKTRGIICDHANNCFLHGLPDDDIEWSLQGAPEKRSKGASDADPVRQCKVCFRVVPSRIPVCPGCDTAFGKTDREILQEEGELKKIESLRQKRKSEALRKREEKNCTTLAELEALAASRGYDPKWAKMKWKFRKNYRPRI